MPTLTLPERAALAVRLVPTGSVVSYGDLGALIGCGPRQAGALMASLADVPWWRVTSASGELPPGLLDEARAQWTAEGIAMKASGRGCRIGVHRADLPAWADAYELAMGAQATDALG